MQKSPAVKKVDMDDQNNVCPLLTIIHKQTMHVMHFCNMQWLLKTCPSPCVTVVEFATIKSLIRLRTKITLHQETHSCIEC